MSKILAEEHHITGRSSYAEWFINLTAFVSVSVLFMASERHLSALIAFIEPLTVWTEHLTPVHKYQ